MIGTLGAPAVHEYWYFLEVPVNAILLAWGTYHKCKNFNCRQTKLQATILNVN